MFPKLTGDVVVLNIDMLWKERQCGNQLEALKKTLSVSFIYVTAHTFQETLQYVRKYKIPLPSIFICESGASIHFAPRYIRHARWGYSLRTIAPFRLQYLTHASGLTLQRKSSQSCYVYKGTSQQCKQFNLYAQQENVALHAIYQHGKVSIFHQSITVFSALAYIFYHCDSHNGVVIVTECVDDVMYTLAQYKFIILAAPHKNRKPLSHMYFTAKNGIEGIIAGWQYHLHKQV